MTFTPAQQALLDRASDDKARAVLMTLFERIQTGKERS